MRSTLCLILVATALLFVSTDSHALLIAGQDIIAAPAFAIDDAPGAENTHQQAFNEAQGVLLTSDLAVDGGTIAKGTVVYSHMIFLNTQGTTQASDQGVQWALDRNIIGVMSDIGGTLEAASSGFLGAAGTTYPSAFGNRGLETNDGYSYVGNIITVDMYVTEPGDWIRVITAGPVIPEPATLGLLGLGLFGLAARQIRRKQR